MRAVVSVLLSLFIAAAAPAHEDVCPQCGAKTGPSGKPVLLIVGNQKGETITFTPQEFAALEQTTVEAAGHDGAKSTYQGVPVGKLLSLAGVDFKGLCSKPKAGPPLLAHYVLIDAEDGYQTVFSLLEVDPSAEGPPVLVACRKDGKPLDATGPFQIVDAKSSVQGRWVRQVARILVRPAGGALPATTADAEPDSPEGPGQLCLVGLGPGDPELVTLRARDVLRRADRVYCFHWLKDEAASFADPGKIVVASPYLMGGRYLGSKPSDFEGKLRDEVQRANAVMADFNAEVRRLREAGKTVAIVAAGDPTIYSPWGWITEQLADLHPAVIPGISSFNAANAALKHGAVGASFFMLSAGHDLAACDEHGRLGGVLVLFTHAMKLPDQVAMLQEKYPQDTPIAVVCDASYPTERVIRGTLGTILGKLESGKLPHLYLIYVGDGLDRKHNSPD